MYRGFAYNSVNPWIPREYIKIPPKFITSIDSSHFDGDKKVIFTCHFLHYNQLITAGIHSVKLLARAMHCGAIIMATNIATLATAYLNKWTASWSTNTIFSEFQVFIATVLLCVCIHVYLICILMQYKFYAIGRLMIMTNSLTSLNFLRNKISLYIVVLLQISFNW